LNIPLALAGRGRCFLGKAVRVVVAKLATASVLITLECLRLRLRVQFLVYRLAPGDGACFLRRREIGAARSRRMVDDMILRNDPRSR
jgi:hypothetical protein